MQDFINISDFDADALRGMLRIGRELREQRNAGQTHEPILAGKTLAMFFEKPSLRTRVSFEQGMYELGGRAIVLGQDEVGLGQRESVADFARVITGMVHGIAARVYDHRNLEEIARHADVPVINMLSDRSHPAQALADVMTIQDEFGADIAGRTVTFVGDGNNCALSLAWLCAKLGAKFIQAGPPGYQLSADDVKQIETACPGASVRVTDDPRAAVAEADAIYCDTFVSMGQEAEKEARLKTFADYRVTEDLLVDAPKHAIVLHCLPAYRGVEITDAVMDGPQSRVFGQAHNRLHAQKGMLAVIMGGKSSA